VFTGILVNGIGETGCVGMKETVNLTGFMKEVNVEQGGF
jgi:hypothetical protein